MIKDCLRIFQNELQKYTDKMVIDNYIPKDGTYLLITMHGDDFLPSEPVDILYNKKEDRVENRTHTDYDYLRQLDYYSKLVEMNKPVDPKKVIHSNNYLTFFVKKESIKEQKVTKEIIGGYYEVLLHPEAKYEKKKNTRELYRTVEEELGQPDASLIKKIHIWVGQNIRELEVDIKRKDYLKLFFVLPDQKKTIDLYQKEGKRYLLPNIYNNNESNINIDSLLFGLPNNNVGMNAKKPYLEHKTRNIKEPYLISMDEALLQDKFFDYLMGKASTGMTHVYVDLKKEEFIFCKPNEFTNKFTYGYYLRIQKGKEVEVHNFDSIPRYSYYLDQVFEFKQVIPIPVKVMATLTTSYGTKNNLGEMEKMIDDVFFGKWLAHNYTTEPGDLNVKDGVIKYNLIKSRDRLYSWFYKDDRSDMEELLKTVSLSLIINSLANGYEWRAKHQLNLRWSLMDYFAENNNMEVIMTDVRKQMREHINCKQDWSFSSDDEYYYAVGQLVAFYLSRTKAGKKPQSFINPFIQAKTDEVIKRRLRQLYPKINYDLDLNDNYRDRTLTGHVFRYQPVNKVNQDMLISGFADRSLVYEKKEEDK